MELTALPEYLDTEEWLAEELPVADDDELQSEMPDVTTNGFDPANDSTI